MSLTEVKGISADEVQRIVAGAPYDSLEDFWRRARASRPVVERLVLAGGFDSIYGLDQGRPGALGRRGRLTRRDLLLFVAELDRWSRAVDGGPPRRTGYRALGAQVRSAPPVRIGHVLDVAAAAASQSRAPASAVQAIDRPTQLVLDLGDAPTLTPASGLPELTEAERVRAELDILGLDVSAHVLAPYAQMLDHLGAVRSNVLREVRSRSEILVAGVKVATQTPPIRSGRRVVFLTLEDGAGPVDATFFEDVQGPYAATVFHSWLLLVRGVIRRTGPRGVSLRATGAWELSGLATTWQAGGYRAVAEILSAVPDPTYGETARTGAAASRSARPVVMPVTEFGDRGAPLRADGPNEVREQAGGMGGGARRVLVHSSGFRQSPYADVAPPGEQVRSGRGLATAPGVADQPGPAPRKLWHSSPGSSGH